MITFISRILAILLLSASLLPLIFAQTCNTTVHCPANAPCCSEYGYCGSGGYCLGGCEPLYSYQASSCLPNPVCVSHTSTFTDLTKVQTNTTAYTGNATAYDWVVNTGSMVQADDGARLILTESNAGTKISSTRYVHYGTIDFVLETSKWAGVVTAAITMSDVKDEIDWEWPGTNDTSAQTNYWYLGIANYSATQGLSVDVTSDTSANFHTYTLDWQAEYLKWLIDGTVVRTVNRDDTLSSDGIYKYPSTPSRIQISIWPAGISTSAQGTIDWAGGLINWQDPDYTTNGYFWNTVQSVDVTCATDGSISSGTTGYMYLANNMSSLPEVAVTNTSIMLSSSRGAAGAPEWRLVATVGGATAALLCFAWAAL